MAAAALLGLLLTVIIGIAVWRVKENTYPVLESGTAVRESEAASENGTAERTDRADAAGGETGAGAAESGASAESGADEQQTAGQQAEEAWEEDGPVRLVFAGDVYLSDHVLSAYEAAGSIRGVVDQALADVIEAGDVFMVNQEFPFSDRGTQAPDKQFTFRLPPERVSLLQEMGIDIVTLANNHALDYGTDALLDTCRTLDEAGIARVGAGETIDAAKKPVFREIKGKTIGFLGATRVIPETSWNAGTQSPGMLATYDPSILLQAIKETRPLCDYLVVYVHWGIEREEYPEEYQSTLGQQYIDAGADLVVGSHPHVLQGIEYYKGKPIVYSLGNFVFGSSIPRTALLTVEWDGEEARLAVTPAVSSGGYTRAVTDAGEKEAFWQYIAELSHGIQVREGEILPAL